MLRKLIFDVATMKHVKLINYAYKFQTNTNVEIFLQNSLVKITEKL